VSNPRGGFDKKVNASPITGALDVTSSVQPTRILIVPVLHMSIKGNRINSLLSEKDPTPGQIFGREKPGAGRDRLLRWNLHLCVKLYGRAAVLIL